MGQRLQYGSRENRIQIGRVHRQRGETWSFVRVARGTYLDVADLPEEVKKWEIRRMVTIARLFAMQHRLRHRGSVIVTGEAALAAAGLPTWWNVPDISYRCAGPRRATRWLPAVTIKQTRVGAVAARHVTGGLQTNGRYAHGDAGLLLAPVAVALLDLARTGHPLQAFVGACGLLGRLSGFARDHVERSRRAEAEVKNRLLRELEPQRGRRGFRLATAVIRSADAGVESPAEGAFLWGLHCSLHPRRRGGLVTQQRAETAGRTYYIDVSIPRLMAGVEIDGASKAGNTADALHRHADKYTTRHQDLIDAGWSIVHVTAASLNTPHLLEVVHAAARKARIAPRTSLPRGRGALFKEMGPDLTARNRRY